MEGVPIGSVRPVTAVQARGMFLTFALHHALSGRLMASDLQKVNAGGGGSAKGECRFGFAVRWNRREPNAFVDQA